MDSPFHTFEQAKLKPVQDLIWKRFLTNRVEHTDGRVFVTTKDARLPKLGGLVSVIEPIRDLPQGGTRLEEAVALAGELVADFEQGLTDLEAVEWHRTSPHYGAVSRRHSGSHTARRTCR